VPDLKTEKRIGVINGLAVMTDLFSGQREGAVHEVLVIARKIPNQGFVINFDKKSQDGLSFKTTATNDNQKKIVNLAFQQEGINSQGYEVSILNVIGSENFRQEEKVGYGNASGKSAGAALYLALLSALHQKPISNRVATTGRIAGGAKKGKTIDGKEVDLKAGDNLPIKGLKEKVPAAVEKGVNILVLSKHQTSPNLLSLSFKDVYYDAGELIKEEK
jgi:predicted ATP-dependent protease